jgi:hypothetical protein
MSFLDTVLIDDHEARSLPGASVVGKIDGIRSPVTRRGGDDQTIPGENGDLPTPLPVDKYLITIPLRIWGASRGERNDNLTALALLIGGFAAGGVVALKRRIATGSADAYLEHSAPGRFATGLSIDVMNPNTGAITLQYYQLKGLWSDDGGTTWTLP